MFVSVPTPLHDKERLLQKLILKDLFKALVCYINNYPV
jgi:hypothetical protein